MQVSPIRNTYCNFYNKRNLSKTSFKGGLNCSDTKRVLDMLRPTVKKVFVGENMDIINVAIEDLANKFQTNSFGVMVIPKRSLGEFCNGKLIVTPTKNPGAYSVGKFTDSEKALEKMQGICISVGDKPGPIEHWTKAYESTVVVLPEKNFIQQ